MIKPPVSATEPSRLAALKSYAILDTPPEADYDGLAALAAQLCHTPMALVSLVDAHRQWCKAKVGIDASEIPHDLGFCAHAIAGAEPLIVEDAARDERFRDNPLVTGSPNIRFYAGFPLLNPDGFVLGTLCVLDREPRTLSPDQVAAVKTLARQVVALLELRRQTELTGAAVSESKLTLRELREAAARYNAVFNANFIAASVVSLPDRTYIDCNQAFLDLIGYKREQLIGRSVAEVGVILGYGDEAEIRTDLYGSGAVRDRRIEITVRGQRIIVLYSAVAVKVDGRLSVLSYMRDVTMFQRMADQTRESEERFKRVFHSSPDPIVILAGLGFRVVDVNEAVSALVGYSRDELIGKLPAELGLIPDLTGSLQAGDAALLGGALRNQEVNLRTRQGETVTVLCSVVAVELDRQPCLLTFMRDITHRKRVEQQIGVLNQALHDQTTLLHSIFLSQGEAVIVAGPSGQVVQFNSEAERLFGADLMGGAPEDWIARYPAFHEDGVTPFTVAERPHMRALRGESVDQKEMLVTLPGGRKAWLAATARPLLGGGKDIQGSVTVFHDISEHKQLEAELTRARDVALESARLRSEFLANMSHEIRTPMNGIMGMTQLLLDTRLSREQREFTETIRDGSDALLTILNDVLDFSKAAAGKLQFDEIDFDLRAAVESALDLFGSQAEAKRLEIVSFVDDQVPRTVRGDPGRLRQVLNNLIGNAIKFTPAGEVVVSAYKQSEAAGEVTLRFEVRDTGIGIPEQAQVRLFNPFVQADGSMTRKYGGTGLGLAICAQIVEQMKGRIWVNSVAGEGSTFTFVATFAHARDEARDYTEINGALAHSRILVVDDNVSNRKMLHHQLSSWGIVHDGVDNGAAALAALRREAEAGHPYNIALLDMHMPGMSGIELAAAIRRDPRIASTRLLMLSSATGRTIEEHAVGGVDAWLNKPVKQSQLFNCLIKLVSGTTAAAAPPLSSSSQPEPGFRPVAEPPVAPVRILVAEDNTTNQKVVLGLLRKLGYRSADAVANGVEALEALTRVPYDLVLMDCQMPEMDGYEATAEIRRRERDQRHTIVIAMTAHALAGEREKCLAAGMDDYLTKPVQLRELEAILRHWSETVVGARERPAKRTAPLDREVLAALRTYQGEGDADVAAEVIDSYLADLDRYIPQMRAALNARDYPQLKQLAHALKGCSGIVGASGLVKLCQEMEIMAPSLDSDTAQALVDKLTAESGRVREALATEKSPKPQNRTGNR